MPTTEELQFEMERRVVLFKSTTTMPDNSALVWDGSPNDVVNGNTAGETLLYNSPIGTEFQQQNGIRWYKRGVVPGGLWEEVSDVQQGHLIYNPTTNRLVSDVSIESPLESLYLGKMNKLSSGGMGIYSTNLFTNTAASPAFSGIMDSSVSENLQAGKGTIPPIGRVYGDFTQFSTNGGPSNSGYVPSGGIVPIFFSFALVGLEVYVENEVFPEDILHYHIYQGVDKTGLEIYRQTLTGVSIPAGGLLDWWFTFPVDFTPELGTVFAILENENLPLSIAEGALVPGIAYATTRIRPFTDKPLAFKEDIAPVAPTYVGKTEWLFAEESAMFSLHEAGTQLALADKNGELLVFKRFTDERGATEWATYKETNYPTLHTAGSYFALADKDGELLWWESVAPPPPVPDPEIEFYMTCGDNSNQDKFDVIFRDTQGVDHSKYFYRLNVTTHSSRGESRLHSAVVITDLVPIYTFNYNLGFGNVMKGKTYTMIWEIHEYANADFSGKIRTKKVIQEITTPIIHHTYVGASVVPITHEGITNVLIGTFTGSSMTIDIPSTQKITSFTVVVDGDSAQEDYDLRFESGHLSRTIKVVKTNMSSYTNYVIKAYFRQDRTEWTIELMYGSTQIVSNLP